MLGWHVSVYKQSQGGDKRPALDHEAICRCDPAHWLVIVAWDES